MMHGQRNIKFLFLVITFQASVMIQPFMSAVCNIINVQILSSAVVLRFLAVLITATDRAKYILGTSVVLHMSFLVQVVLGHPIKAYGGGIAPLILNRHEMMASGQFDAPAALRPGDKAPGTHSTRCWLDPKEGQSTSEKRKNLLPLPRMETRFLGRIIRGLVTMSTELFRLQILLFSNNKFYFLSDRYNIIRNPEHTTSVGNASNLCSGSHRFESRPTLTVVIVLVLSDTY
jgi:hypothetical protein